MSQEARSVKIDERTGVTYRQWLYHEHSAPYPAPNAVLLLVHGLGAHSGRWESLADFFLQRGISSYAIELRGFGETKDLKGHVDSFDVYFKDIARLFDVIKEENPGKKVFILGESLGGLISFLLAIRAPALFDGLVCISPAFDSRLKFTTLGYIKIFFFLVFNPKRQLKVPFNSGMCTREISYQNKMDSDDREHRLATPKLLFDTLVSQVRAKNLKGKLRIPVLFLLAGEDKLVNPDTAKKIFNGLKVQDKTIMQYDEMYHALSIELGKEKVFSDILAWLQKRI